MTQNDDPEEAVTKDTSPVPDASTFGASAGKLILRLFGPLADEMGQYLADGFRQWRWRRENFKKVAERCELEKEAREMDDSSLAAVAEGDAFRLAEGCSFEDDETVQEMWAGLITSAMDPKTDVVSTRAFAEILKAIGPVEAGLLLVLYQINRPPRRPSVSNWNSLSEEQLRSIQNQVADADNKWLQDTVALADRAYRRFPDDQMEIAIQNLFRLRCIGLRTGKNLSQSQTRTGIPFGVRGSDAAPTYDSFAKVVDYLESLILVGSGTGHYNQGILSNSHPLLQTLPEVRFELTRLGRTLVSLCMTNALRQEVIQELT